MADVCPLDTMALVKDARVLAQHLAMEMPGCSPLLRDEILRQIGKAFQEAMYLAGASESAAQEFGGQMEEAIRSLVSDIVASGGTNTGSA